MSNKASPTWLASLDELSIHYTKAAEAHAVFQNDALHSDPSDDEAEVAAEAISDECTSIRAQIRDLLAPVTDHELLEVFDDKGAGARREALAA